MKTKKLNYNKFSNYMKILIKLISCNCNKKGINIDGVYGPPRGGLPIATQFSHAFNTNLILDLDNYIQNNNLNKFFHIIICDDVCDSGQTFNEIYKKLNIKYFKAIFCSLYIKPRSLDNFTPEFFVKSVSNDTWLVFPWEYDYRPDKKYMLNSKI